jgi:hypothetical protein
MKKFRYIPWVLFVLIFAIGAMSFDDYGIPMDEETEDRLGMRTYEYIFNDREWPKEDDIRYMGPLFTFSVYTVQQIRGLEIQDFKERVFTRHFMIFITFFVGLVCFYFLIKQLGYSSIYALLGVLMIFLSPRIFGHSFFNSKDIPTMSAFIASMLTLSIFIKNKTVWTAILHGVITAIAISIRHPMIIIPAITLLFIAFEEKKEISKYGIYMMSTCVFTIIFWPYLWSNPISNFIEAYTYVSGLGSNLFFLGESLSKAPIYYNFLWIFITTPLLYSIFFVVGLTTVIIRICKNKKNIKDINILIPLIWFFAPLLILVITNVANYDGWRHAYYTYPAFILISLAGINYISKKVKIRCILPVVLSLNFFFLGLWIVNNHPLEHAYFSIPAGFIEDRFELDYWGVSSREALEFIAEKDPREVIKLFSTVEMAHINSAAFFEDTYFEAVAHAEDADYIFDNFRANGYNKIYPEENKIYSIRSGNIEVSAVYMSDKFLKEINAK